MNQSNPNLSPVISDPQEVVVRLRQVHKTLNPGWFTESLRTGLAKKANTTILHGKIYPGMVMHFESTNRYREISMPKGWTPMSTINCETTVSPDSLVVVAIAGGDVYTGRPDRTPATRNAKGLVIRQAVRQNRQAELLFIEGAETNNKRIFDKSRPVADYRITWVLLHAIVNDELRCEFSCPQEIDELGKINKWTQRLILPSIPLDLEGVRRPEDEPIVPLVDIRRRG